MANPFYVEPFGGAPVGQQYGQMLTGLGMAIADKRKEDARLQKLQEGQQAITEAFQSNDPNKIAETMIAYPELSQTLQGAMQFRSDATRQNFVDSAREVLINPDRAGEILQGRIETIINEGGNPTETVLALKEYEENPEGFFQSAKNVYATYDPEGFQAYMKAQPETEDPVDLQYKDGVVFNPRTGETERAAVQPRDKKPKLVEVKGGVKYFDDGSEMSIGAGEGVKNPITGKTMTPEKADEILSEGKEFQLKNGGFAVTLADNLSTIDRMYAQGYDPTRAAWAEAAFDSGAVSNLIKSDEDQVFMGAVDEMINAIARRETGAAITEFERKDFFNRYMPRPGDSKNRLTQKRNSLERQLKSIAGQSGGVFEALTMQSDFGSTPSQFTDEAKTGVSGGTSSFVIENHPQYGNVTEQDIQETMRANNMTRDQVMSRLGGQ